MNKYGFILGLAFLLTGPAFAGSFNLHRGDLIDTDTVDIEWRVQTGNCPTKFPVESMDCEYFYSNAKGLKAVYIDMFSQHANFNTENTYLLNVSINGEPVSSCQLLQQKVVGYSLVTLNKEGCIIG